MMLVAVVLTAMALHARPAFALSYLCQQSGIGCISFSGYNGTSVWGYPVDRNGNNCTNYAAFRFRQNGLGNPGNLGNAGSWAANAQAKGFRVDQIPAVGAIAQWDYGSGYAPSAGHVAYVEQVTANGFIETESNWAARAGASASTVVIAIGQTVSSTSLDLVVAAEAAAVPD